MDPTRVDRFAEMPRGRSRLPTPKKQGPNSTSALLCSILQWLDLHRHATIGVAVFNRARSSCIVASPILWSCKKGPVQSRASMRPSIVKRHRWISIICTAAFYPTPTPSGLVPEYSLDCGEEPRDLAQSTFPQQYDRGCECYDNLSCI